MVPSSPYGPCRRGKTTSTFPRSAASTISPSSKMISRARPSPGTMSIRDLSPAIVAPLSPSSRYNVGSSGTFTHFPSGVIPTVRTSNLERSMFSRTPAAVEHEIECSPERPPNTISTRGFIWEEFTVLRYRSFPLLPVQLALLNKFDVYTVHLA